MQIPLGVKWVAKNGSALEEDTETGVVSAHGCTVWLKGVVFEGIAVELTNRDTKMVRKGRVTFCGEIGPDGRNQVGIELDEPDPKFWGSQYAEFAPWTGEERRRHPRYKCVGSVGLIPQGTELETRESLSDISHDGCYVNTMSPLSSGTSVRASLQLMGELIQTEAVVQVSHPAVGMGLKFMQLDKENRARLDKVLTQLAGEPKPGPPRAVESLPPSSPPVNTLETSAVLEALVEVLESKGVLSRQELLQAIERAKAPGPSS
ncbi:MAG: PilZ domain-containing protein [Acidobacteriota bacterium]